MTAIVNATRSPTLRERIVVRRTLPGTTCPIIVVADSSQQPQQRGASWHYTTRGGTRIYHPSAYSKSGWSNMVYHASTLRIEVGDRWFVGQMFLADMSRTAWQRYRAVGQRLEGAAS